MSAKLTRIPQQERWSVLGFMDEMIRKNELEDDGLTFDNEDILDEIDGMDEDEAREYLESEGYEADDFEF